MAKAIKHKIIALTTCFALSVSTAVAYSLDFYDIYEDVQNYNGYSFETSFDCIYQTLNQFLGSLPDDTERQESLIMSVSEKYNAIVHFSGEQANSDMVAIDWVEVIEYQNRPQEGFVTLSSSHVNFNTMSMSLPDQTANPFRTNAYNEGHEIATDMDASVLEGILRDCPTDMASALS